MRIVNALRKKKVKKSKVKFSIQYVHSSAEDLKKMEKKKIRAVNGAKTEAL